MADENRRPPRIAEWILERLHSDRKHYTHLGDFEEVYNEILHRRGAAAAGLWYVGQILKSIPGFFLTRFYWSGVMFRNYFVISWRNLKRNCGASLINLAGLAVGMTCFLLILTFVRYETSYDRFHEKADRIFRVLARSEGSGWSVVTPDVLASALPSNIPGIVRATSVYRPWSDKPILEWQEKRFFQKGLFADNAFLQVFSFPAILGDRRTALAQPSSIVLANSVARKLFGGEDPIGKVVVWKTPGSRRDLTVTAVLKDVPRNSHLQFDHLISLETLRADKSNANMFGSWNISYFDNYVELAEGWNREAVETLLPGMMTKVAAENADAGLASRKYAIQPLTDIHLRSNSAFGLSSDGDIRYVRLFLAIAFLILVIACVNHVNLATARSAGRAREIGIRKLTGAFRIQIFEQFLGETFFLTFAAGGLAVGLLLLVRPGFGRWADIPLRFHLLGQNGLWLWFGATLAFVCLAAGIYPAFVLSGVSPARTLKKYAASGKQSIFLRNLLVVFQFAASVILIAATVVVFGQMNHVRSMRLGYNRNQVVIVQAREEEALKKLPALKEAFERRPEVVKASLSVSLPTRLGVRYYDLPATRDDGQKIKMNYHCGYVDESFLDVFEIELAAGRNFRRGDRDAMILNEAALNELGWKEPLGKKFRIGREGEVVGVVKDFHFESLHNKIGPMALFYNAGGGQIAVRVRPGDPAKSIETLRTVFEQTIHGQPFDYSFLDDSFNALYKKEIRTGEIFAAFAVLAILIACLGLLGLTSLSVARRKKEIGIRKVLGASNSRLVLLLNKDFLRLVAAANILAWPVAYLAMNKWLENFAYRIPVGSWIFLLSGGLSLGVALFVVGWQTVRAALIDPAETLRYE